MTFTLGQRVRFVYARHRGDKGPPPQVGATVTALAADGFVGLWLDTGGGLWCAPGLLARMQDRGRG